MIELRNQLVNLELIRGRLANKEWHGVVRLSDSVMFEFMKKFHQDMIEIVDERRGVITDMKSMELDGENRLSDDDYLPTPYGKLWSKRLRLERKLVSAEEERNKFIVRAMKMVEDYPHLPTVMFDLDLWEVVEKTHPRRRTPADWCM